MSTQQTYFFSQDDDSHWYMIPVEKLHRWRQLSNGRDDDEDNNDAINAEFGEFRTGGGIDHILFIPILSKRNNVSYTNVGDIRTQLALARHLILDIKRGNIYQEPADECDKWLTNNPEIK